ESILFQLVRWPWALIGCVNAVWSCVTGRENGFKVTPKRAGAEQPLPIRVIAPYLVLTVISILPVLLVSDPGRAEGYYFWALLNGATYLAVSIAIVALHIAENRAHMTIRSMLRFAGVRLAAIAVAAAGLTGAVLLHGGAGIAGLTWPGQMPAIAQ